MKTLILSLVPIAIMLIGYAFSPEGSGRYAKKTETYYSDTVESGSSDSIKSVDIDGPTAYITIACKQLDTNATNPDSLLFYNGIQNFYTPVDVKCCQDSVKRFLDFTYNLSGSGEKQERSGWIYQPKMTGLKAQMYNKKYLTNRRVLVDIGIFYE